jgi:hypothetical protein
MTFLHVVANLTYQIYYSVVTSIPEKSLNKIGVLFTFSFYAIFKCLDYVDSFSNNIDFGFISLSFTYLPTHRMSNVNC